ncbi:excinuclease ABC subunit UvrC [Rickettsiales bacterium]|nr:excinuclease ABC subunit UvrC [Rickettsiales bacterium]
MSGEETLKNGVEIIKKFLKNMPSSAGVYRMIDKNGQVLYVGKAKNLPKRVVNYTRPERLEYRLQQMISKTIHMEIIQTETEIEALLLEANLIKKYEPKYNILLKDDKSFPYILIADEHDYPRIMKYRGQQKAKGTYYGPFASAGAVNQALSDLQKAFLLRPCTDSFFKARTRPCMEYQIKRCSAPCVNKISKEQYGELITQAKEFLKGKSRDVQNQMVAKMQAASEMMDYEKATIYRDRIKALNHIQAAQDINASIVSDADVIAMYRLGAACCVQMIFYRNGQHLGSKAYFPKHTNDQSDEDVMAAFILQFYQNHPVVGQLILSHSPKEEESVKEALEILSDRKIDIIAPQKGKKKKLVELALKNAKSSLNQKQIGQAKEAENLAGVARIFGMEKSPKRIEVYDNSHIMGTNEVGAMIVAGEGGFNKKAYRRFNIKGDEAHKGDDYAMMRQVLMRRLVRLKQEFPQYQEFAWPDLIMIDGGAGHLSVVDKVFEELGFKDKITLVCISKGPDRNAGREQFHMAGKDAFTLPVNDPTLYYLQTIRDEVHNFAIGSHRKKRAKSFIKSALDEIPGVGAGRKKLLLLHFGDADSIKQAKLEDLLKVEGINRKVAQAIYDHFHE